MGRVKDPLYRGLLFGDAFFARLFLGLSNIFGMRIPRLPLGSGFRFRLYRLWG